MLLYYVLIIDLPHCGHAAVKRNRRSRHMNYTRVKLHDEQAGKKFFPVAYLFRRICAET